MLRLLVIVLLSLTPLQAEPVTRAYYVGKHQLGKWLDRDPTVSSPTSLKKAPFKSPHFNDGDILYNFAIFEKQLNVVEGTINHLIYNQSTGRLIVSADEAAHHFFHSHALANVQKVPKTIELQLELFEDNKPVFSTNLKSKSGTESKTRLQKDQTNLLVTWEPYFPKKRWKAPIQPSYFVEATFSIQGRLNHEMIDLKFHLTTFDGFENQINFGSVSSKRGPLTLRLTHFNLLPSDVREIDTVLDDQGKSTYQSPDWPSETQVIAKGQKEPETGLILRTYHLAPRFLEFLLRPTQVFPFTDPFENTPVNAVIANEKRLTQWDPRIKASPSDYVIDCSEALSNAVIFESEESFGVLNHSTSTLFILAKEDDFTRFEQWVANQHSELVRNDLGFFQTRFELFETPTKPTLASLKKDGNLISKISATQFSGQSSKTFLGINKLELDAQSNDNVVEVRFDLSAENNYSFRGGGTLEQGIPQIIQSTFLNGKWQSLVVTATLRTPWDKDQ